MLKVFSYLKKSALSILLIIALLIVQAICDLSLPDYTSRIINVGVQQGGIESAVPEVMRQGEFDDVLLFVDDQTKDEILEQYRLVDKDTLDEEEYEKLVKKYPALEEEALYLLEDTSSSEKKN